MRKSENSVSVIIPTRNRVSRLWGAIKSVIDQGPSIRQVIIVDDSSSDLTSESHELLRHFDSRIEVHRSRCRIGGAAARNLGVTKAKGDLIAFLDDDDIWLEGKVDKQIAFLNGHDSYGAVLCSELRVNMQTGHSSVSRPGRVDRRRLIAHFPCPGTSCLMMRRPLFAMVGGFNPTLRRLQDWDFYLRLCAITELGVIREPLTLYVDHIGEQISKSREALYPSYRRIFFNIRASLDPGELSHFRLFLIAQRSIGHYSRFKQISLKLKIKLFKFLGSWL